MSGGLDSATVLGMAYKECDELFALTLIYGQKHEREIKSAKAIAKHYNVKKHLILELPLKEVAKSSLIQEEMEIPTTGVQPNKIPTTYVPGRNIIFLAVASSWAESIGATRVYGGMNAVDYSGYPDCRPEFIAAMNRAIALGTEVGNTEKAIQIITPLIDMTKSQIIKKGMELSVPYQLTWSCYIGGKKACGVCDSCRIRLKGFSDAGLTDPIQYENRR